MSDPIAIFLLGGPGSGKDYLLKNIFTRFGLIELNVDQVLSGKARSLIQDHMNLVVNGCDSAEKIYRVKTLLEGYEFDNVFVSVTNKVSRERNASRDKSLTEDKRIAKWYKAEQLGKSVDDGFVFNNSINLQESSEMERLLFANQIEKLLERLTEMGLSLIDSPVVESKPDINQAFSEAVAAPVDMKPVLKPKPPRTGKLRVPPNPYSSQVGGGGGSNVFGGLMPQVAVEAVKPKMKKFSQYSCGCDSCKK